MTQRRREWLTSYNRCGPPRYFGRRRFLQFASLGAVAAAVVVVFPAVPWRQTPVQLPSRVDHRVRIAGAHGIRVFPLQKGRLIPDLMLYSPRLPLL
ncbi:MAG: twin-arginine translocation signal domain-containing protein [Candidatus Binataceae bacterium]